jgi:hypothetical protein
VKYKLGEAKLARRCPLLAKEDPDAKGGIPWWGKRMFVYQDARNDDVRRS